ncbi:MAG: carbohydrate kinase [Bacteroidales bacterium]|nr:carbohydrate kinase [Bacteroidales bacterium]
MIVGIGELLWDVFPDGRRVAGGAPFNFAFHCHQLGHEAIIISRVGSDALGSDLRAVLRSHGMNDAGVQTDAHHPTGTVTVAINPDGQPSYTITENVAWDHLEWVPQLDAIAQTATVLCFGTLAQRSVPTRAVIDKFLTSATHALQVLDVNLRGPLRRELYDRLQQQFQQCDWLKVNAEEVRNFLHGEDWETNVCEPMSPKESPIRYIFDTRGNPRRVGILTCGQKGVAITDWQRTEWVPGVSVDVVDTVGAGDAFTAAMVCLHREGRSLRECARFANLYAAKVCEHQGATPRIDRQDVERVIFRD